MTNLAELATPTAALWSERLIARAIALQTFKRRYLVAVPNCTWTGHECDLLVVTDDLRIIDVEVKISRADLRADAKKEKWWTRRWAFPFTGTTGGHALAGPPAPPMPNSHPPKVWKHYYALPKEIWTPDLEASLPSKESGILLLHRDYESGYPKPVGHRPEIAVSCIRRAKPNRHAEKISAAAAVDIARLASLRMWDSYQQLEAATSKVVG
ncbi:hypothetical protein [Massilia oculi]|uniref:hypothetical protein n=1 Tax=Massilia oculi TaxID=945844 RepID=UPI001AAEAA22|nr:hypothetical protein [Massilia oculi]